MAEFQVPARMASGFSHNFILAYPGEEIVEKKDKKAAADKPPDATSTFGFGTNGHDTLGLGQKSVYATTKQKEEKEGNFRQPELLAFFRGKFISEVACGGHHSMFLEKRPDQDGGALWTCGLGNNGRLGVARPATADKARDLFIGSGYPKAKVDELVEDPGFLSRLTEQGRYPSWTLCDPVRVEMPTKSVKIAQVTCGMDHTLVRTEHGDVFSWGVGNYGNLGSGHTGDIFTPEKVLMPDNSPTIDIAAGTKHSLAIARGGGLFAWGHGGNGRLGVGDLKHAALTPVKLTEGVDRAMVSVAAGEAHSASIDTLGVIYCWGAGSYGRTGHGEDTDVPVPRPVVSLAGKPCVRVALGMLHSLALTVEGVIYSWGAGLATGLIPIGDTSIRATPMKIHENGKKLYGKPIVQISAGPFHSLAMQRSGAVFAWGQGSEFRLGLGKDERSRPWPELMVNKLGEEQFFWNAEKSAEIEKGRKGKQQSYEQIEAWDPSAGDPTKVMTLFAGGMHSAALAENGELYLWGSCEYGQQGLGQPDKQGLGQPSRANDVYKPKLMAIPNQKVIIRMVALGLEHSLALTQSNEVLAWGRGSSGQLGTGRTRDEHSPVVLNSLSNVQMIGAGEDHSAAVIMHSGDLFTWGCAECGKLGHGSSMTTGSMQLPRQVSVSDRMVSVTCGGQHTAVLNAQKELFTFGAGWFGRLGHGAEQSNMYAPTKVEHFAYDTNDPPEDIIDAMKVKDVQCASYHTCIVSEDDSLWVCGRDRLVCQADHVKVPLYFDWCSDSAGKALKVKQVVCYAQHTLLLSQAGDLWVWGENKKGQLGMDPNLRPRLIEPEIVHSQKWGGKKNIKIQGLCTGIAHSMALLSSGEVVAWGLKSSGRLGLERLNPVKEDYKPHDQVNVISEFILNHEGGDVPLRAGQGGTVVQLKGNGDAEIDFGTRTGLQVVPKGDLGRLKPAKEDRTTKQPELVYATWHVVEKEEADGDTPEADNTDEVATGEGTEEGAHKTTVVDVDKAEAVVENFGAEGEEDDQRESKFTILQKKLRSEPEENKEEWLRTEELRLKESYTQFIDHIFSLWNPPKAVTPERPFQPTEKTLQEIEAKFDQSVCKNLNLLDLADHYPCLDGLKIHPEISLKLHLYEELLWVLQQQPCYLARSAMLFDVEKDKEKGEVWFRVVRNLFAEISDQRTRLLYLSLIRLTIHKELMDSKMKWEMVFDSASSKVVRLFGFMMTHPHFKELHEQMIDGENEESLIRRVEFWTYWRVSDLDVDDDNRKDPNFSRTDPRGKEHGNTETNEGGLEETLFALDEDVIKDEEAAPPEGTDEAQFYRNRFGVHMAVFQSFISKEFILGFLPNFMKDLPNEVKCIMCKVFETLEGASYAQHYRDKPKEQPKIFEPIQKLVVLCCLAKPILEHESLMTYEMRKKMEGRIRLKVSTFNEKFASPVMSPQDRKEYERLVSKLINRVHWNFYQLGDFLWKTVTNSFLQSQGLVKSKGGVMMSQLSPMIMKVTQGSKDDTETQLTIDLYRSHYDLSTHHVTVWTYDLLRLSNMLFDMGDLPELPRDKLLQLTQSKKDDRLCNLLEEIQPFEEPSIPVDKKKSKNKVNWSEFYLTITEACSLPHNFKVRHRFLEFHKDLCFCRESQAPIPRSLANESQRWASELRTLKPYKAAPGEKIDDKYPFLELEALFSAKELPLIKSFDFQAMKYEFEEIQKNINVRNAEKKDVNEFGLIATIETAKRFLDKLRQHLVVEEKLQKFFSEALESRDGHRSYLIQVKNGITEIKKARENYEVLLPRLVRASHAVLEASETSKMPDSIKHKAVEVGAKLKFIPIEKAKKHQKRKDDDAGRTEELETYPSATFKLGWLRERKIIARMNDKIPTGSYPNIRFVFSYLDSGDWQIEVQFMDKGKPRVLRKFFVTKHQLDIMRGAGKTARMPFDDEFVYINCFNLLQHLARISAGIY